MLIRFQYIHGLLFNQIYSWLLYISTGRYNQWPNITSTEASWLSTANVLQENQLFQYQWTPNPPSQVPPFPTQGITILFRETPFQITEHLGPASISNKTCHRKISRNIYIRDLCLEIPDQSEISQVPRPLCVRVSCQITDQYYTSNYQFGGLDYSRDLTKILLTPYWVN